MKCVTRQETEVRLQINALFFPVTRAALRWTPPSAFIKLLRDSRDLRDSDPDESYWMARNATDFMNEQVGMDKIPTLIDQILVRAGLTDEETVRTRAWALGTLTNRHQTRLNQIPVDWIHKNT